MNFEHPIKYMEFERVFPTIEDAYSFYKKLHPPICGCGNSNLSAYKKSKLSLVYCRKCNKSFSIFKDTIFKKLKSDLRYWFYIGYLFEHKSRSRNSIRPYYTINEVTFLINKPAYSTVQRIYKAIQNLYKSEEIEDYLFCLNTFYPILREVSKSTLPTFIR